MTSDITKVAVIGAGVMGASIAAQIANGGVSVRLIDMPQKGLGKKNALAEEAIEKLKKMNPAPLMHKRVAKLIEPGNTGALQDVADCDWIIEAIVEKSDIKRQLYRDLEKVCTPGTLISSNTSTIPLSVLVEGMSDAFQENFLITHFFNPPRYMRLLELVKGDKTSEEACRKIATFVDYKLGKSVVKCHDTPGFIANRIGIFWIQTALLEALDCAIDIEDADAVLSKPLGIPKTGAFALMDLVGLDLMPHIGRSLKETLPASDLYCQTHREVPLVQKLIEEGYTGRKGKGGFYRLVTEEDGSKRKEALDLGTGTYRAKRSPRLGSLDVSREGLQRFFTFGDQGSEYALAVMTKTLWYALSLVPEIAKSPLDVDTAMKLGYNWKYGPFELVDRLGPAWFRDHLKKIGMTVPPLLEEVGTGTFYRVEAHQLDYFSTEGRYKPVIRPPGQVLLQDIKRASKPLAKNGSAALWDVGDQVACLEFTSKMNTIDGEIFKIIHQALEIVPAQNFKGLVLYNEGANFSVGANLGLALFAVNIGLWPQIEDMVKGGQDAYQALKYAPFPVVGAPSGMALGGGCEVLLHCDAVQAHAEFYTGLVEVGVGVVPAWGGCKEMMTRWLTASKRPGGAMVAIGKVFEMIGTAKVAKSAMEAQEMLFMREGDRITMNKDRLLADAKERTLELVEGYTVPEPHPLSLPGTVAKVAMNMAVKGFVKSGKATAYDEVVSEKLSGILSGGDTDITDTQTEDSILALERQAFMELLHNRETLDRMEHILATGKPLRN